MGIDPTQPSMAETVGQVWEGQMLAGATASGMSRLDIAALTVETATVIVQSTASALWDHLRNGDSYNPEEAHPDEKEAVATVALLLDDLRAATAQLKAKAAAAQE